MSASELLAELHPSRSLHEDVLEPLGMSVNALATATGLNEVVLGPTRRQG